MKCLLLMLALALTQAGPPTPTDPAAPAAREIAPDTFLLAGSWLPDRGPDGNSIVLAGPSGLVVVDTRGTLVRAQPIRGTAKL